MYGLDKHADLSFLPASVFIQLRVGQNELVLAFDSDALVTVEGSIEIGMPGKESRHDDLLGAVPALLGLLGRSVISYEVRSCIPARLDNCRRKAMTAVTGRSDADSRSRLAGEVLS
ncbi:hypothetical protein HDC94_002565 [Leifsonia sp. AK011]|nr:hypothetical protein [Leifsonia sp. AK011]